jgi:hypothetical protein
MSRRIRGDQKPPYKMAPPTTDVGGADTISDPQWRHPSAKGVCRRAADSGRLPSMKSSLNAPNSCYFRPSPYGACCSPDAARQGGIQASLVARLRPGHEHRLVRRGPSMAALGRVAEHLDKPPNLRLLCVEKRGTEPRSFDDALAFLTAFSGAESMAATFGDVASLTDACVAAGVDPSAWDAAGRQGDRKLWRYPPPGARTTNALSCNHRFARGH